MEKEGKGSPNPSPSSTPRTAHIASAVILRLLFVVIVLLPSPAHSVNITALLAPFPDLASFSALLSSTSVAADLESRSSLTLLAVTNSALLHPPAPSSDLADCARYHVLLRYISPADLRLVPPSGLLVTTLFQTTGRAPANLGAVNLTRDPKSGAIHVKPPTNPSFSSPFSSTATVLRLVTALPYNVTIYAIDSLLVPAAPDLAASENRPPSSSGPAPLNITQVLLDAHDFFVAASMLQASGVAQEFQDDERGAGITVFVPTDEAFARVSKDANRRLQSLPADQKAVVLRFHVLHSYYPLGSLESIVNPVQPTLATEDSGAGRYTLNISRVNGSVAIDTAIVQAIVTRTVFDQNPVAVFGVSRVLLPREIFAADGEAPPASSAGSGVAPPPGSSESSSPASFAPLGAPSLYGDSSDSPTVSASGDFVTSQGGRTRSGGISGSCFFFCPSSSIPLLIYSTISSLGTVYLLLLPLV